LRKEKKKTTKKIYPENKIQNFPLDWSNFSDMSLCIVYTNGLVLFFAKFVIKHQSLKNFTADSCLEKIIAGKKVMIFSKYLTNDSFI